MHQGEEEQAGQPDRQRRREVDVLRGLGTFSASTVVSTFEKPFQENGPEVVVIGSPVPTAAYLEEAAAA